MESVVEHIISSNSYSAAHHIIQLRNVPHNQAKVGIHSHRLTLLKRQAETFDSLKLARRAQLAAQVPPATSSERNPSGTGASELYPAQSA